MIYAVTAWSFVLAAVLMLFEVGARADELADDQLRGSDPSPILN
jgi:hypothetical protein